MNPDQRTALQVGAALRRIRQGQGVNQRAVAMSAGVTSAMLSDYERGKRCPVLPTLVKLLQALGCTVEAFGRHVGPWGGV